MKMHRPGLTRFLAILLACQAGVVFASPGAIPRPPSEEQKSHWRQHGRTLPQPEVLQPRLDDRLPAYVPRADGELAGDYTGTTSDVLVDLTQRWIAAFQRHYPKVKLTLQPPYAGSLGARELIKGDLDFVLVSRELKPEDRVDFQAKFGYEPFNAPIVGGTWRHFGFLDAVVFFVHEDNPLSRLSYAQLDALLSSTRFRGGREIRRWGDLGLTGEWAGQPINVWAIQPWNGFEEFVRQRVLSVGGQRGEWREDLNFVKTVFPVSEEVAKDRHAIGYAGLAYVGPGVKLLALAEDDGSGPVAPTYEEVALARYPLSRLCYFNYNQPPDRELHPVMAEFMRFMLSREGQQVVIDQGVFLPLREEQAQESRRLLQR